jgi:hypothetical protein
MTFFRFLEITLMNRCLSVVFLICRLFCVTFTTDLLFSFLSFVVAFARHDRRGRDEVAGPCQGSHDARAARKQDTSNCVPIVSSSASHNTRIALCVVCVFGTEQTTLGLELARVVDDIAVARKALESLG